MIDRSTTDSFAQYVLRWLVEDDPSYTGKPKNVWTMRFVPQDYIHWGGARPACSIMRVEEAGLIVGHKKFLALLKRDFGRVKMHPEVAATVSRDLASYRKILTAAQASGRAAELEEFLWTRHGLAVIADARGAAGLFANPGLRTALGLACLCLIVGAVTLVTIKNA